MEDKNNDKEEMNKQKIRKTEKVLSIIIAWLEAILAVLIIITFVISTKDLVALIIKVFTTEAMGSYDVLQKFLSHVLLLVVGLELALMLIKHTPGNVLEVMLYAIARKMLIYTTTTTDILIGVIALGLIFFIDKYLHTKDKGRIIK